MKFGTRVSYSNFAKMELRAISYYGYLTISLRKLAHAINKFFLALKIEHFQLKKFDIFLIFCSKHKLWVLVRTASPGGSNEYPQSMFWSKNKKNRYTPAYPTFTITPLLLYKIC